MAQSLKGKVALVTGGSRGIGAAIVKRLAAEGANVAFNYAKSQDRAQQVLQEIEELGVKGLALQADQGDTKSVTELVNKVHENFGRLDILVNSAGVFVTGSVEDQNADLEAFERQLAVNVTGVTAAVRAAAPILSNGGRIVSIGTTGAIRAPFGGIGDYVATKAAIAAYSRSWARDFGPRNITVNMVHPGAINTEMNPETSDFAPALSQMAALGRYGQPEDIAGAVAFLVGPDAGYITGTELVVDGGQLT